MTKGSFYPRSAYRSAALGIRDRKREERKGRGKRRGEREEGEEEGERERGERKSGGRVRRPDGIRRVTPPRVGGI